jgi:tetratricopeptide (TPR) repeat protein
MAIDPYAYCPCGSGKKVKFCCADLADDMERIQTMLEGGQRAAALDHIEKLEQTHPDNPYLVTTKALLQSVLGSPDKASATLEAFLAKQPNNAMALAEKSVVDGARHGAPAGIRPLQQALENSEEVLSHRVVSGVARLGEMLLAEGRLASARGHFMLAYGMNPQDERSLQMLARFFSSPSIPLVLKNEQTISAGKSGAPYAAEFDAAVEEARRGLWWKAADKLKQLTPKAENDPALWQNLAVLRSWLDDMPGTVAALRKQAALDVPFDEAVEAEALAQLFDPTGDADVIEEVRLNVDIKDFEKVAETLASDKRAAAFSWESLGIDFGDQPSPRSAYYLLDRPMPATGVDIARGDIPRIVARMLIFGRQTDREARIEAYLRRPDVETFKNGVAAIVGDAVGAAGEPEKVDDIPAAEAALSWSWRLPDDTPPAHIRKLVEEQRRDAVLNSWPNMKSIRFGNQSAAEAAGQPQYRIPVAAQVLLIELSFTQAATEDIFDELRSKLGLPIPATPDPKEFGPLGVPYSRLHRLNAESLSDEELVQSFQRALQVGARSAIRKLGLVVVGRASLKGKIDLAAVYGHLAAMEETSDQALVYLESARKAAVEQKQSAAPWYLEELDVRLRRGEIQEFGRLVEVLQRNHIREPGVAQALMQILMEAGIVGPDGRPRAMPGAMPAGAAGAGESGKLWTPDSPSAPAPAGGATKSGLWVPD